MIRSMTGFGRCEISDEACKLSVEMKSVNHRYLDLGMKLPKKFNVFEAAIRSVLKEYIQRGKVDLYLSYEDFTEENVSLKYNSVLAAEYVKAGRQMAQQFDLPMDLTAVSLSKMPEVLTMEQEKEDEEALWERLERALRGACEKFVEAREKEGEQLKEDLCRKLVHMDEWVYAIEERAPQIVAQYREKLEAKVKELLQDGSVEENRICTEVTIFADKICTDEETVRLHTHIKHMKEALEAGGNIGRKLDFIAQEMNREANTILSKANDMETSSIGIDLKTEIEKIREQIQNIE